MRVGYGNKAKLQKWMTLNQRSPLQREILLRSHTTAWLRGKQVQHVIFATCAHFADILCKFYLQGLRRVVY